MHQRRTGEGSSALLFSSYCLLTVCCWAVSSGSCCGGTLSYVSGYISFSPMDEMTVRLSW